MAKTAKLPPAFAALTEKQLKLYGKIFNALDTQEDGTISYQAMAAALRFIGGNPSQEELAEMMQELDPNRGRGNLDYPMFLSAIIRPPVVPVLSEEEVREAFRTIDQTDDCLIPNGELRMMLQTMSEKLDDSEMELFFKHADPLETGFVDYEKWITTLYAPPEKKKKKKKKK